MCPKFGHASKIRRRATISAEIQKHYVFMYEKYFLILKKDDRTLSDIILGAVSGQMCKDSIHLYVSIAFLNNIEIWPLFDHNKSRSILSFSNGKCIYKISYSCLHPVSSKY